MEYFSTTNTCYSMCKPQRHYKKVRQKKVFNFMSIKYPRKTCSGRAQISGHQSLYFKGLKKMESLCLKFLLLPGEKRGFGKKRGDDSTALPKY